MVQLLREKVHCFVPVAPSLREVYRTYFRDKGWDLIFILEKDLKDFHQKNPQAKLIIFPEENCESLLHRNSLEAKHTIVLGAMCSTNRFCQGGNCSARSFCSHDIDNQNLQRAINSIKS